MNQYIFYLVSATLFNAVSHVFFKYSSLHSQQKILSLILIALGLLFGMMFALFYTKSLKGISLNVAYPVFSATGIVLVTLISIFIFSESITLLKIVGIGVISLGVVLVSM